MFFIYVTFSLIIHKRLENKLLVIRSVGLKFPNSGALYKLLVNLYKKEIINCKTKINSLNQCVSIVTDIMYNNPRTYNICVAILSKFFEPLKPNKRLSMINAILDKFESIPNTEYLNIWLQRLTIVDNKNKKFPTSICQKAYKNNKILDISNTIYLDLINKAEVQKITSYNKSKYMYKEIVNELQFVYNLLENGNVLMAICLLRNTYEEIMYVMATSLQIELDINVQTKAGYFKEIVCDNIEELLSDNFEKESKTYTVIYQKLRM